MLEFLPYEAPRRFIFEDPDTGRIYKAYTKKQLVDQILNYRMQNRLPIIENLSRVIDNYLCALPENAGKCQQATIERGLFAYIKGAVTLLEKVLFGDEELTTQEEADRRATICAHALPDDSPCPKNVFPDKGPFIEFSDNLAKASTDGRKAAYHEELGNCAVCSCVLKAKVWYKNCTFTAAQTKEAPDFCWCLTAPKEQK